MSAPYGVNKIMGCIAMVEGLGVTIIRRAVFNKDK